jgi:putative hydrolase of the HAD superfamily
MGVTNEEATPTERHRERRHTVIKAIIFDLGNTLIVEGNPLGRITPFPEMRQVLTALKARYKLALITNVQSTTTREYVEAVLREVGIHDLFDVITVSSHVGVDKPNTRIFTMTLEQLHVQPEEAVMVGNIIATDIFGGNRVGMTTVLVQREHAYQRSSWETPDHTIGSLADLLSLVTSTSEDRGR